MRALGYCRVSTVEQEESRAGLDAQEATIRGAIDYRGWDLLDIRFDVASGKSLRRRPEFGSALRELRAGHADVLVVAKLDRLSRSVLDFANIMATAHEEGWSLVVLDMDIDTTSTNGKLMAQIFMALAEWERNLIGDRTRSALVAVRARGTKLGRPSGVTPETLRLIRVLRTSGKSWQRIADALTTENVATAQGGTWHAATVRKLYLSAR